MNTIVGYSVEHKPADSGDALQSLLLLVRRFLNRSDAGIQRGHAWNSSQFMPNVPQRVWKRHSALLTLLVQNQSDSGDPESSTAE